MCNTTDVLCAALATSFLTLIGTAQQGTEVTVQSGEVRIQTPTATTTIAPGQKALLDPGGPIKLAVDNPVVKDLLLIDKWVQEEKAAKRLQIDHTLAAVVSIEGDRPWKYAFLAETPNDESAASSTCRIGWTPILKNPKCYDMEGRELKVDVNKRSETMGDYVLHFHCPIPAGGKFKWICLVEGESPVGVSMWQNETLWYIRIGHYLPHGLSYCRLVLPKTAIFVDATSRPVIIDQTDSRPTITLRNYCLYSKAPGVENETVAFLWPERDGTTLADVPPNYRGLRNKRDAALAEEYERQIANIRAGLKYSDQSTPVRALLTWCSAIVRQDTDQYLNLLANSLTEDRKTLEANAPRSEEAWQQLLHEFVDNMMLLSTPSWPATPSNGYLHPVYVSRPSSMIKDDMHAFAYSNGKWYWARSARWDPWHTDITYFKPQTKPTSGSGMTWVTLDYPWARYVNANGISGSNVVGFYWDSTGNCHGLLHDLATGSWKTLDYPKAARTAAMGISGSNIVGAYYNSRDLNSGHVFLHNLAAGDWKTLDKPDAINAIAIGTSGANTVLVYSQPSKPSHGFFYNGKTWTTLDYPGARWTQTEGISDDGNTIVGRYADSTNTSRHAHGASYDVKTATWTTFSYPRAAWTNPYGTDGTHVVGFYTDGSRGGSFHGFLYNLKDKTWTKLDYPGAKSTIARGVSGKKIVGTYTDSKDNDHGFLLTLPESGS